MQSSALPTELILPWSQLQYLLETSYFNTKLIVLIIKISLFQGYQSIMTFLQGTLCSTIQLNLKRKPQTLNYNFRVSENLIFTRS